MKELEYNHFSQIQGLPSFCINIFLKLLITVPGYKAILSSIDIVELDYLSYIFSGTTARICCFSRLVTIKILVSVYPDVPNCQSIAELMI